MAVDLHKDFARLSTSSPQPAEQVAPGRERYEVEEDGDDYGSDYEPWGGRTHDEGEQTVGDGAKYARHKPSLDYFEDAPTPPIDVPNPVSDYGDRRNLHSGLHDSFGFDEASPDDVASSKSSKQTSLSFDPVVKLDSGAKVALEAPLPKPYGFSSGFRGRSLLEEIHKQRELNMRALSRARSETDQEEYDPETGERIDEDGRRRDPRYVAAQPRWPFLQTTVDELASTNKRDPYARDSSLTSRSTASPLVEEVRTPEAAPGPDCLISPISIPSPLARSAWSSPVASPKPLIAAQRSRSYGTDRKVRRSSRRSNSSMSPASAFLGQYKSVAAAPDPDAEGQEVGDYVMGREIGFGGFSIIREAYTFQAGTRIQRAVKIVRREVYGKGEVENESLQAEFEHEVSLWRYLHHKHILPLIAVYISDFATFAFMPMNTTGTLFDAVRKERSGLPGWKARRYAYQLASALRYLHEDMRIVHRDVKLENCLLDLTSPTAEDDGGTVLLCDFGLADYVTTPANPTTTGTGTSSSGRQPSPVSSSGLNHRGAGNDPRSAQSPHHTFGPSDTSTSLAGSLPYAAPELLEAGRGILDPRVDVWAYGVVCYTMISGKLPFNHPFAPRTRVMILSGEYDHEPLDKRADEVIESSQGSDNGFDGMIEHVENCLERVPALRPDIRWVLDSGWLEPERREDEDF